MSSSINKEQSVPCLAALGPRIKGAQVTTLGIVAPNQPAGRGAEGRREALTPGRGLAKPGGAPTAGHRPIYARSAASIGPSSSSDPGLNPWDKGPHPLGDIPAMLRL